MLSDVFARIAAIGRTLVHHVAESQRLLLISTGLLIRLARTIDGENVKEYTYRHQWLSGGRRNDQLTFVEAIFQVFDSQSDCLLNGTLFKQRFSESF